VPGYRTTPMALPGGRLLLRGWTSKVGAGLGRKLPRRTAACPPHTGAFT
jgi:hypothetical protein